jgi:hypothetical protein
MLELPQMLELAQQSRQPPRAGAGEIDMSFKTTQYSRYQALTDTMHARLANADRKIDRGIFETFCKRVLAVTFLDWMCKP